ncbi:MAG TPA: histidine--tRNA ligase [Candidatus Bathyarchaeia archaeon]|nr:histidine--tRNA ligase [Candidatus Bathyarchaeia archaeon]
MSEFKTVRGMRDLLPEEARIMKYIEEKARRTAELYGFKEIITPVVESYELLSAKAGDEVRSRMFVFKDLGERNVALRPEFTASVARLVATALRTEPKPFRLFSFGSIYRYDEPQKGRYREFWQSNYELMGSNRPEADAEILLLTDSLMKAVRLRGYKFKVGHVGVLRGILAQENVEDKVQNAVMQLMDKRQYEDAFRMVEEGGMSQKGVNVLRNLVELKGEKVFDVVEDMKNCVEGYEKAVKATENLSEILKLISESGNKISVIVDAGFARGLEYYTGIIFEVYVPDLDIALGGGGRYDRLIELFGGEPTPAVGVAHGIDRIMLSIQLQMTKPEYGEERTVMVIPVQEELKTEALKIAQTLRNAGMMVEFEVMGRKMAKALEDADRRGINYAVIVGEREFKEGRVMIKDLKRREQSTVEIGKIREAIKNNA